MTLSVLSIVDTFLQARMCALFVEEHGADSAMVSVLIDELWVGRTTHDSSRSVIFVFKEVQSHDFSSTFNIIKCACSQDIF